MFKDNRRNTNSKGPLFKTVDVLSLAFAAHRVNNGYEKFGQNSFDEKTGTTIVHKYANKDIVKYQITGRYIPSNYIHITVKEEDRQKAVKAKDHFEKYMFNILGGDINDFTQNILDVIFKEEVTKYDLGLLAYIPEMIDRDTKNDSLEELLQKEYLNSEYLGPVKEKFSGKCKILNSRFLHGYNCWIYLAGCNGNLLSFFNKKSLIVNSELEITARIKYQGKNKVNNNIKETGINYVKII